MRALRISVLVASVCTFLQACATTKPAEEDPAGGAADGEGPPPEAFESLAAAAFDAACETAKGDLACKVAVSAEGDKFQSCDCSAVGNAVGAGQLTIVGTNEQDGRVDADFELVDRGAGWVLGKLLVDRGVAPK